MADITIITYLWGDTHNGFIDRWVTGIESLNDKPRQVVVITDRKNPAAVDHLPYTIIKDNLNMSTRTQVLNRVIGSLQTVWVGLCDIDDELLPKAFDPLLVAGDADVCANGIRFRSTGIAARSNPFMFHSIPTLNHVMVNSYFRRDKFDEIGGFPDITFHDWGLWWKFHKHKAKWHISQDVQMIYNDIPSEFRHTNQLDYRATQEALDWIATYQVGQR